MSEFIHQHQANFSNKSYFKKIFEENYQTKKIACIPEINIVYNQITKIQEEVTKAKTEKINFSKCIKLQEICKYFTFFQNIIKNQLKNEEIEIENEPCCVAFLYLKDIWSETKISRMADVMCEENKKSRLKHLSVVVEQNKSNDPNSMRFSLENLHFPITRKTVSKKKTDFSNNMNHLNISFNSINLHDINSDFNNDNFEKNLEKLTENPLFDDSFNSQPNLFDSSLLISSPSSALIKRLELQCFQVENRNKVVDEWTKQIKKNIFFYQFENVIFSFTDIFFHSNVIPFFLLNLMNNFPSNEIEKSKIVEFFKHIFMGSVSPSQIMLLLEKFSRLKGFYFSFILFYY